LGGIVKISVGIFLFGALGSGIKGRSDKGERNNKVLFNVCLAWSFLEATSVKKIKIAKTLANRMYDMVFAAITYADVCVSGSKPKCKPEGYHAVCVQYVALSCCLSAKQSAKSKHCMPLLDSAAIEP
jgi:hypothetical protein